MFKQSSIIIETFNLFLFEKIAASIQTQHKRSIAFRILFIIISLFIVSSRKIRSFSLYMEI